MRNARDPKGIVLTEDSKKAFNYLKRVIVSEPIMLHYPDWQLPFAIHTDASKEGVAGIPCRARRGQHRKGTNVRIQNFERH